MEDGPQPIGPTIEALLDQAVFGDPDIRIQKLKAEWEESQRTEREVFERVCREEYEGRVMYHTICQTPNPEAAARHETNLCKPMWKEELDERLGIIWSRILMRVSAVLEDKRDEAAEDAPADEGQGDPMLQ